MKKLLSGAAAAAVIALALPAWSQTNQMSGQSTQSYAPGYGGEFKSGAPRIARQQIWADCDPIRNYCAGNWPTQAGIRVTFKGCPGNKSGPAVNPPDAGR
jgi:hypothetical protein